MSDDFPETTLSVYFATGGTAQLPILDIEELPSILRNLRNAVANGTVYSVFYNNLTWTVNGALIASFEVKHPDLHKMISEWEKQNPLPRKKKWWELW